MRKSAGFTLIELVIVIVILGILGAVAAPKLFNLQGDAYGANLNAMKSSISTAATMANAKAQIQGKFDVSGAGNNPVNQVQGYEGIKFVSGYPAAIVKATTPAAGILATLEEFDAARYTVAAIAAAGAEPAKITITPKAAANPATCNVTYIQAVAADTTVTPVILAQSAKVEAVTDGC